MRRLLAAVVFTALAFMSATGPVSAAPAGKGSGRSSYSLMFGPNVLDPGGYQIVYAPGTDQQIIDNVNAAAAKATRQTGVQIGTAPAARVITLEVTTDDVCGNGCTYTSFDGTYIVGAAIRLESWIPATYNRALAVHELGHALGLGHVNDPTQIMNPTWTAGSSPYTWARGDLAGLALL